MVSITPSMLVSLSRMPPLISSHDTVSCYHLTCFPLDCSKQVFIIIPQIPQLCQSFDSPVTTQNMKYETCCWHHIQHKRIFIKNNEVEEGKQYMIYSYFVLFSLKFMSKSMSKLLHSVYLLFCTLGQYM